MLEQLHSSPVWGLFFSSPWGLPGLIFVVAAFVFFVFFRAHRRWKHGWLTGLIAERVVSIRSRRSKTDRVRPATWKSGFTTIRLSLFETWDATFTYLSGRFFVELRDFHLPSFPSLLVIGTIIALFFLVPRPPSIAEFMHWGNWWSDLTTDLQRPEDKTGDLIAGAFTGLAVVVIALVVFVAESIRDDNDYERKRILVRISLLWPLGLAATIIPFGFLWSPARGLTILLETMVAIFTLIAFAQVIRELLDPDKRARSRLDLLRSRVRGMIEDSVRERIGNAVLFEQLGVGKRIDTFSYTMSRTWIEDDAQGYVFVDAPDEGWVYDIQLDELKSLGERLDRHARQVLGFALRDGGPKVDAVAVENEQPIQTQDSLPVRKAYLLKRYREEIPPDSVFYGKQRSILALPQAFGESRSVLADIHATIPHIFRFTNEEPSSVAIRREMQGTKDQLTKAIRSTALGAIEELRQIYLQIAEEFLTLLVRFGGGYSAEQARKERGNFFESWSEIRWLLTDFRELISVAADSGNIDILGTIGFLPFAVAMRALQVRDHFLFQQFYQFAIYLYVLSRDTPKGSTLREWLTDKAWRWPKEIATFYVARELDAKSATLAELEQAGDFALFTLQVFQDLLKDMADRRDMAAFTTVVLEFKKLYRNFREDRDSARSAVLRLQIERIDDENQKDVLREQLALQEKRDAIAAKLNISIDEILLALSGRLLAQCLAKSDDDAKKLLDLLSTLLPMTLERLAETFAEASDWHVSDLWGWSRWDLVADGEAHWIDQHTKLNQIFVVRALDMLAALSPEIRTSIRFPVSRSLAEMVRDGNPQGVLATLRRIEDEKSRWQNIISDAARSCIGDLRELLIAVWNGQKSIEAEMIRTAPLDRNTLGEFRTELLRSLVDGGRMRAILEAKGAIDRRLDDHPGSAVPSLGFNQIDDKGAFIVQERTSYVGWGRGYGEGLAQGEDETVFGAMVKGAAVQRDVLSGAVIAEINDTLKEGKFRDAIILQSLSFQMENAALLNNSNFTPKYVQNVRTPWRHINGYMGILYAGGYEIPVFDIVVRQAELQNKILIVQPDAFVRWRQFAPDDSADERVDVVNGLLIRVTDLNVSEERRNAIIAEKPPWLMQETDPAAYLRGRALVNIFEKFRIDIENVNAGVCLSLMVAKDKTETVSEAPIPVG